MILEVSWGGLGTLSFGLSQFHGHGSWVVCDVTLGRLRLINGYVVECDKKKILTILCAALFMVFSGTNNSEFHCAITFHYRSLFFTNKSQIDYLNTIEH